MKRQGRQSQVRLCAPVRVSLYTRIVLSGLGYMRFDFHPRSPFHQRPIHHSRRGNRSQASLEQ